MRAIVFASGRPALAGRYGLLFLLALAVGCGGVAKGKVSGVVKYRGEPLPGGRIDFRPVSSTQNPVSAIVDEQGHYEAVLPAGKVQISVDNRELEPPPAHLSGLPPELRGAVGKAIGKAPAAAPPPPPPSDKLTGASAPSKIPGHYKRIPSKYYDVTTSGLEITVKGGNQEENLELTDR